MTVQRLHDPRVEIVLRPAAPNAGIVFHRVDLDRPVAIHADALHVGDTRLSSTLKHDGAAISTVEHMMSALAGLEQALWDLKGSAVGLPAWQMLGGKVRDKVRSYAWIGGDRPHEIPIMDGSAGPFVFLLQSAGIVEQESPKRYLRILAPVEVRDGDKWARFDPFNGFKLDFTIDFPHPMFGSENRNVVIDFAEHSYVKEVARARTFGASSESAAAMSSSERARVDGSRVCATRSLTADARTSPHSRSSPSVG